MVTLKRNFPLYSTACIHVFQNTIHVDSAITIVTKCIDPQICMLNTYVPTVFYHDNFTIATILSWQQI